MSKKAPILVVFQLLWLPVAALPASSQAAPGEAAGHRTWRLAIDQPGVDRFRLEIFDAETHQPLFDSGIASGDSIDVALPAEPLPRTLTYELRTWDAAGELLTSQVSRLANSGAGEISSIDLELIPPGVQLTGAAIELDAPTSVTGDLTVAGALRTAELRNASNSAFVQTCNVGSSIRSIDASGAVLCEVDDLHNHTATQNIHLNGHWLSGDGGDEGIFVNGAGNVGIGSSDLTEAKLRVDGGPNGRFTFNFTAGIPVFRLVSGDSDPVVLSMEAPTGSFQLRVTSDNEFQIFIFGPVVTIDGSGKVGIAQPDPAFLLHLGIDSAAKPGSATWTIASDARLKDVQGEFTRGLEALAGIQPVRFHYRQGNALALPSDRSYVGLLAQEVAATIPEAVKTGPGGYLHLETDPILWTMLNAVHQLEQQNRDLWSALCAESKAGEGCGRRP